MYIYIYLLCTRFIAHDLVLTIPCCCCQCYSTKANLLDVKLHCMLEMQRKQYTLFCFSVQ